MIPKEQTIVVQTTHSLHCKIHGLPPEILSAIFVLIVWPKQPEGIPVEELQDHFVEELRPWQYASRISQVCKAWHDIALETKELWVHLKCPPLENLEAILPKSDPLPIVIWTNDPACVPLYLTASTGSRLKQLIVHMEDSPDHARPAARATFLRNLANAAAFDNPLLESLVLLGADHHSNPFVRITLTEMLLKFPRSALRELVIKDCILPKEIAPSFPHLEILDLCNGGTMVPHITVLLNLLSRTPNLKRCRIQVPDDDPRQRPILSQDFTTLTLPRLESLDIAIEEYEYGAALLTHIHTPHISRGTYSIGPSLWAEPADPPQAISHILKGLGLTVETTIHPLYRAASLHLGRTSLIIGLSPSVAEQPPNCKKTPAPHTNDYPIVIKMAFGHDSDVFPGQTTCVVLNELFVPDLRSLTITKVFTRATRSMTGGICPSLLSLLNRHSQVSHLEFDGTEVAVVKRVLDDLSRYYESESQPSEQSSGSSKQVILPLLEQVTFRSVFFNEYNPDINPRQKKGIQIGTMIGFVHERGSQRVPIRGINLQRCAGISHTLLLNIKDSIQLVRVVWDGFSCKFPVGSADDSESDSDSEIENALGYTKW